MSDRHEKWVRVEPGHVIPAGQPYRVEREYVQTFAVEVDDKCWFIDSSWKPPLVLPTEPTWGIAVFRWQHVLDAVMGLWRTEEPRWLRCSGSSARTISHERVLDFIPLTDEQVARIEAAR